MKQILSYDVVFNDAENSNNKGFHATLEFCQDYISRNNGTFASYFAKYIGGTVAIVCNQTGDTIFQTEVLKPA